MFRFAVMGAGNIAGKFCQAFRWVQDAEVAAVASRDADRAARFAAQHGVPRSFGSYEEMLEQVKPDAVYIATTPFFHYDNVMLCLAHNTPVLCEKAMFVNTAQAEAAFAEAERRGIFTMEATWTLFLPNMRNMRRWIQSGEIGEPVLASSSAGWIPGDGAQRFPTAVPRGGAMLHMGIYCYELLEYLLGCPGEELRALSRFAPNGVDDTAEAAIGRFGNCIADMQSTTMSCMDEHVAIYGTLGRIYAPHAHWGNESYLYRNGTQEPVCFRDALTENGFEYEIQEVVRCVRAGKTESEVVPHALTRHCCALFDQINAGRAANI